MKEHISIGKELVALIRDALIVVLVLLLLVFPSQLNRTLSAAGFEEGTFAGMKWKSGLFKSNAELVQMKIEVMQLRQRLKSTQEALAKAEKDLDNPKLTKEIAEISVLNDQALRSAERTTRDASTVLALNAPLAREAEQALFGRETQWAVIFGGDTTLESARYETEVVAPRLSLPNAGVYLRKGSYRSVSVVDSRAQAEEVLQRAKRRSPDAYLVPMSSWCPTPVPAQGYTEC